MADSMQQNSKKRKGRNDKDNRDYICPCGKSYLSYPALFTHVKQKHNGKAPGDIIKPVNEKGKRGRPRSNSININVALEPPESDTSWLKSIQAALTTQPDLSPTTFNSTPTSTPHSHSTLNCSQILGLFLEQLQSTSPQLDQTKKNIVRRFVGLVKHSVNRFFQQEDYTETHNAQEIINCSNDMVRRDFEAMKDELPFSQDTAEILAKSLFEWLYLRRFTDHALWNRSSDKSQHKSQDSENPDPPSPTIV